MLKSYLFGIGVALALAGTATAADVSVPVTPEAIYDNGDFSWDGLYVGVQGGAEFFTGATDGFIGLHLGANFVPATPFLVGIEGTADYQFGGGTSEGVFFANLRAGAIVTDPVLIYALGGVGHSTAVAGVGLYQLGGGLEFAAADSLSVRGQVAGVGDFDGLADSFFESTRASVGVSYHF